ncbi:MAG TPA: SDR family NAD(P)-dependent oxidoreductase [Acidimicrobiia bacterium]|nr:SDR family NAD(P)-dependent oxidoreductase [Acidimicrobiia bacterium]
MDLDATRVVVTGASTGIGRVTALRLARKGAQVWAAARDERRLESLAGEHAGIVPAPGDVSDDADRAALVKEAEPVDVLVNNAGLGWKGVVESMPPERVRQLFEVNVLALIDLTQRVLPGMLERRRGHIVNVGSMAGYVAAPGEAVYSATKFAVQGFTDGLRREVIRRGVQVTLIAPGPIKTEFMARIRTGEPAGEPGALDYGLPPESVAKAIVRALTHERIPGYRTITVPRIGGFSRLGSAPVMTHATDLATRGRTRKALEGED